MQRFGFSLAHMTSTPTADNLDAHLSAREITALLVGELRELVVQLGSQAELANVLGYSSQASISKLLKGRQRFPRSKAVMIDRWIAEADHGTQCGETFVDLVDSLRLATRAEAQKQTDVFLASPMSAGPMETYEPHRKLAMELVRAIRDQGLRTYFAGEEITKPSQFDAHDLAYKANLRHIEDSRLFVLYLPPSSGEHPSTDAPVAPSSVWIELGMALARNLPVTIFAPSTGALPFVVRRAVEDSPRGDLVLDVQLYDNPRQPARWIRKHGRAKLLGAGNVTTHGR